VQEDLIADAQKLGHFGKNSLIQFSVLLKQVLPSVPETHLSNSLNSKKQKCSLYCYIHTVLGPFEAGPAIDPRNVFN
jgi:hypothetical protein